MNEDRLRAWSMGLKPRMDYKMKWIIPLLLTIFIFACSDNETENNSTFNSQDSLTKKSFTDTVVIKDSTVVKERFYDNLSYTNNFKLIYYERDRTGEYLIHYWTILVYDKKMNLLDSIIQPVYVLYSNWIDFEKSRSFITGVNKNKIAPDNYYGDFVVADFNFDKRNDFAIINDMGGNGGTFYSYYIQGADKQFALDSFLTDSMTYFPAEFNSKNKTLVTYTHAGACWLGEHIYQIGTVNKWSELSHRQIDVCNEKE
ncbi:MAG TPA: hypothetical protein DIW47_04770 [Bacteroidetes bacterium]|nr:hypothetical protein [Bacteroidota bacterium]